MFLIFPTAADFKWIRVAPQAPFAKIEDTLVKFAGTRRAFRHACAADSIALLSCVHRSKSSELDQREIIISEVLLIGMEVGSKGKINLKV